MTQSKTGIRAMIEDLELVVEMMRDPKSIHVVEGQIEVLKDWMISPVTGRERALPEVMKALQIQIVILQDQIETMELAIERIQARMVLDAQEAGKQKA